MPRLCINNVNIYYEVSGQGEPLLFIHGLTSSSRSWKKQVPVFSQHYRVITFDIRGHGRSDKPLGLYSIELFAADAVELMKALGISSAHVVGFSLGGMVGFQLAVDVPEMVKSLVAVNSCPEGSMRTFNDSIECFKHIVLRQFNGMRRKEQDTIEQLVPASDRKNSHQSVIERLAMNNKLAYANAFRSLVVWSVVDRLHTISCPTLLVTSDQDYVPVSVKQSYASKMPCVELTVINNSSHAIPNERAEEFNTVVMEFLSSSRDWAVTQLANDRR